MYTDDVVLKVSSSDTSCARRRVPADAVKGVPREEGRRHARIHRDAVMVRRSRSKEPSGRRAPRSAARRARRTRASRSSCPSAAAAATPAPAARPPRPRPRRPRRQSKGSHSIAAAAAGRLRGRVSFQGARAAVEDLSEGAVQMERGSRVRSEHKCVAARARRALVVVLLTALCDDRRPDHGCGCRCGRCRVRACRADRTPAIHLRAAAIGFVSRTNRNGKARSTPSAIELARAAKRPSSGHRTRASCSRDAAAVAHETLTSVPDCPPRARLRAECGVCRRAGRQVTEAGPSRAWT